MSVCLTLSTCVTFGCLPWQASMLEPVMCRVFFWQFDNIARRFLEEDVGVFQVLSESDIWLQR